MKAVICDECLVKAELKPAGGFFPTGWVTVIQHHQTLANKEQQFCSPECAVLKLSKEPPYDHQTT